MDEIRSRDPIELFQAWLAEARESEPNDPEAMCLATVDAAGNPSARMILLKSVDHRGFAFYTNLESRKGLELDDPAPRRPVFSLEVAPPSGAGRRPRRAGLAGRGGRLFRNEATRQPDRRLGVASIAARWIGRETLEARVADTELRFAGGSVPRPPNWSGFRVVPRGNRILARSASPPARPHPVSPVARRLDRRAPLSLTRS